MSRGSAGFCPELLPMVRVTQGRRHLHFEFGAEVRIGRDLRIPEAPGKVISAVYGEALLL